MNQLLSQIWTLQDKVDALNEEKFFYDTEAVSSSGMSHVPSHPSRLSSPRGLISRDSGLPHTVHGTRWILQEPFFFFSKVTCSRKDISFITWNCHETGRRSETRTAEFDKTDSTIFQES